jgi:parvulin-like peptidyl-prolyl isomerase
MARYVESEQVRASHILLTVAQNAPKRVIKKQKKAARKLYKQVRKKDADFARLAKENSTDSKSKVHGGDLGFFPRKGVPKISRDFEKAITKLKENEISKPIKTSKGIHLVKLNSRQARQVKVAHIFLKSPQRLKQIDTLIQRAQNEPFDLLAKEYSEDERSRLKGGDIGYIHPSAKHRFGEIFKQACLDLQFGEVSKAIKTGDGIHIIRVIGERRERLQASHILISLPKKPRKAQIKAAKKKAKSLLDELNRRPELISSRFAQLAKEHSDDVSTKHRGGDLGLFYIGGQPKFSQEFEKSAFELKQYEVSKPVRSPLGYHIIKLTDRKPYREQPFEEVRPEIEKRLFDREFRKMKAKLLKKLKGDAQIDTYIQLESVRKLLKKSPNPKKIIEKKRRDLERKRIKKQRKTHQK